MTVQRILSFGKSEWGILYLVNTPIGNLGDMSQRAIEILSEVHIIAAEDTRHTRKLLTHFNIEGPQVVSYHEHNKHVAVHPLLEALEAGRSVACVTDAGTPGISDPGEDLVVAVRERGGIVSVVPGPTAAIAALTLSGLPTRTFSFVGFLPRQSKMRLEVLETWKFRSETLLFYEAPHRVKETLHDLGKSFGTERRVAAVRELTKKYEEVMIGTLIEVSELLAGENIRGEWVLVVEGASKEQQQQVALEQAEILAQIPLRDRVEQLIESGIAKKEAIKQVAKERNLTRNEVYQEVLDF